MPAEPAACAVTSDVTSLLVAPSANSPAAASSASGQTLSGFQYNANRYEQN